MKPYYQSGLVTLYNGDSRRLLRSLRTPIAAVITDPPYNIGAAKWDGKYPYDMVERFKTLTDGPIVTFGAASTMQDDLAAFRKRNLSPQRVVIWHVTFTHTRASSHGLYYRYHPIYCWQLPKRHGGPNQDVIAIPQDGHNGWYHKGTKPIKLMRLLVGVAPTGGVILDPYAGSGSTLRAAKDTGRPAIGIELEERSCRIIVKRMAQETFVL